MKKGLLLIFAAIVCTTVFNSCRPIIGEGKVVDQNRSLSGFTGVDVALPFDVEIVVNEAAPTSVVVRGYENLMSHIKTEVKDGNLKIYATGLNYVVDDSPVVVKVTVPSLTSINVSGTADVEVKGKITGTNFNAGLSGAGSIEIADLNVNTFNAHISGTGSMDIDTGTVQSAGYSLSGVGSISAFSLICNDVNAHVSGTGSIELMAQHTLNASVSGVGSIEYKGHPALTLHTSGVGSIEEAN